MRSRGRKRRNPVYSESRENVVETMRGRDSERHARKPTTKRQEKGMVEEHQLGSTRRGWRLLAEFDWSRFVGRDRFLLVCGVVEVWNSGSLRSTKAGVCQQKASWATSPTTAPCYERLASGERVVGQCHSWTVMKRWSPCMGCTAQWKQKLRSSEPSRGPS